MITSPVSAYTPVVFPDEGVIKIFRCDPQLDTPNTVYTFMPDGRASLQSIDSYIRSESKKGVFSDILNLVKNSSKIDAYVAKKMADTFAERIRSNPENFNIIV